MIMLTAVSSNTIWPSRFNFFIRSPPFNQLLTILLPAIKSPGCFNSKSE
jgi:hypothetical protein